MRHLVIGDIHGCFRALQTLLDIVQPAPDDVLITLGDYVDRGPDSQAVLDRLIAEQQKRTVIALRGNHEVMMLEARNHADALKDWCYNGGYATLRSYSESNDEGKLTDVPDSHWQFLEATRPWFETASHFFVHANAHPDLELDEQPDLYLYWESLIQPIHHVSGKIMVCGHTRQKDGIPKHFGSTICLDTWVYGSGWLTCLDLQSGKYWQANQKGKSREGVLKP